MIRSPIARTGTLKPARTRKCAVKGCGNHFQRGQSGLQPIWVGGRVQVGNAVTALQGRGVSINSFSRHLECACNCLVSVCELICAVQRSLLYKWETDRWNADDVFMNRKCIEVDAPCTFAWIGKNGVAIVLMVWNRMHCGRLVIERTKIVA